MSTQDKTDKGLPPRKFKSPDHQRVRLPRLHKPPGRSKPSYSAKPSQREFKDTNSKTPEHKMLEVEGTSNCLSLKNEKILKISAFVRAKRSIQHLSMHRPGTNETNSRNFLSFDSPRIQPHTHLRCRTTKREYFKRRTNMQDCPLVVLKFEGVAGDVFKTSLFSMGPLKLYLRQGVVKGLKQLQKHCQIVLFLRSKKIKTGKIIDYFSRKAVVFDGIYRSLAQQIFESQTKKSRQNYGKYNMPFKYSEYIEDYSQIAFDFQISSVAEKMLIVSSIDLSVDDLQNTYGQELIYHQEGCMQLLGKSIPTHRDKNQPLPVSLLVPDPRVSDLKCLSFRVVVKKIISLISVSWVESFQMIMKNPQKKIEALQTSIYQFMILQQAVSQQTVANFLSSNRVKDHKQEKGCVCYLKMKENCGQIECQTMKKLEAFLIVDREIPSEILTNKILVLRSPAKGQYVSVQDHLVVEKPFTSFFKKYHQTFFY